ncbi:hypothetical protein GDO78_003423 [Eleutherodactylus coqui]|uniref:Uncharacterized protein n=1 Tax=Eleutherodactylus coqui TaxID=57060 RepID=A0A8J6K133_ELECQ|nr:hypothetical protein GDO78_003423 [Eleutherodactylus coqui]
MASADLRDELNCSICLSLYTDPVSLRCGHNFCRSCIVSALDAVGVYSCPDCKEEYLQCPALEKTRRLVDIVECFLSSQPNMKSRIFCTYCIKSPVPAVRTCLQCENSLCDDHLTAHNKAVDHIVTDPTSSFGNKKVLEYYCLQDGKHRGHQVELQDEASEKKKEKLRKYLGELNPQKAELQTKVKNLHDHPGKSLREEEEPQEDIVTSVTLELGFQVPDIWLDKETANKEVELSDDLKTAKDAEEEQPRPESLRFLSYRQVLGRYGLPSGRHYWEVAWNQIGGCNIGVFYPNIEREEKQSGIGDNDNSWCLDLYNGIFLDYEAGRLSFYELCDPIRYLHTFTVFFTNPLHVAFYVEEGASVTITS